MAYNNEVKNKFIKLRAEGLSMSEISRKLKCSLPTLQKWEYENRYQIDKLESVLEKESLLEAEILLKNRIKFLTNELEKAYNVLDKRNLAGMKSKDLFSLIENLEPQLKSFLPEKPANEEENTNVIVNIINENGEVINTTVPDDTVKKRLLSNKITERQG